MSQSTPTSPDAAAAQAVRRHHAQLAAELDERVEALLRLVETQFLIKAEQVRQDLVAYLEREILPHARAEESTLYPAAAARPEGGPLVAGMINEHHAIGALVGELDRTESLIRAAAAARGLAALFATHLAKENDLILPMLLGSADTSLAGLLAGMHEILGAGEEHEHGHGHDHADEHGHEHGEAPAGSGGCGCGGGGCGCGGSDGSGAAGEAPVLTLDKRLDVRDLPHNRRHMAVLSTVESLAPGEAMVLVAGHAPRPVLAEVEARFTGQFATQWLQAGPDVWQVRLERVAAHA